MNVNAKIKMQRKEKGLTLENLAALTGFTKGYLSKIERSTVPPPFATVQKIAEAMQMDMMALFNTGSEKPEPHNIDLVRSAAGEPRVDQETDAIYSFIPLVNSYRNKQMSPFLFQVRKGETEHTTHDSEEFVYVLDGCLELIYEGRSYALRQGDSFYLDARIMHYFINRQEKTAVLLAVHFNYRRF
jgi:transcriptional regulator with XRE-family HTH domain